MYDERGYPVKSSESQPTSPGPRGSSSQGETPSYASTAQPLGGQPLAAAGGYQNSGGQQQYGGGVNQNSNLHAPYQQHRPSEPPVYPERQLRAEWTSGVLDCLSDAAVCMDTMCCYPCQLGRLYSYADKGRNDHCEGAVCLLSCCCGIAACVNCYSRMKLVKKFNLDEDVAVTAACACCLPLCSACQQHREILARGGFPGGTCFATTRPPQFGSMH